MNFLKTNKSKIVASALLGLALTILLPFLAKAATYTYSYGGRSSSTGGARVAIFLIILFCIGLYIFFAYCLQCLAKKTNTPNGWMAYVPGLNLYLVSQLAQKPKWWVVLLLIPFVNFIFWILTWIELVKKFGKPAWWGPLMVVSPINAVLIGIMAFEKTGPQIATAPPAVKPISAAAPTVRPKPSGKPTMDWSATKPDMLSAILHFVVGAILLLPSLYELLVTGGRVFGYYGYYGVWFSIAPYVVGGALIYLGYSELRQRKDFWRSAIIDGAAILYLVLLSFSGFMVLVYLLSIVALGFCLVRLITQKTKWSRGQDIFAKTPKPVKVAPLVKPAPPAQEPTPEPAPRPTPTKAPTVPEDLTEKGMFCTQCGTQVGEGTKFCPGCGKELPKRVIKKGHGKNFCSQCGNKIKATDKFCGNCGAEL